MTARPEPEISVVMPVRNEAGAIEAALDAVLAQNLDAPFEVVVADGRSTDGTREILERRAARDARLRVVDNPGGGTPQALNGAFQAARGRYVVRVDGHTVAPPDYVRRLVAHLRSGSCEGVGGRKRAVGTTPFGRAVAAAHGSRFGIGDSKYHYSDRAEYVDHVPFGAYLAERIHRIGGWDEELVANQDYDFDYRYGRSGGRILLDPSIVIDWRVRETPGALARQYHRYGYWKFRTLARHPSSLHLRWLAPAALVLALAAGVLASPTVPGRWLLAAVAGAYLAFLALGALAIGRRAGVRLAPRIAAALAIMHLSHGVGFLTSAAQAAVNAVRPSRRARAVRAKSSS